MKSEYLVTRNNLPPGHSEQRLRICEPLKYAALYSSLLSATKHSNLEFTRTTYISPVPFMDSYDIFAQFFVHFRFSQKQNIFFSSLYCCENTQIFKKSFEKNTHEYFCLHRTVV